LLKNESQADLEIEAWDFSGFWKMAFGVFLMSFLPIVERELRAGSRRKATYRLRWWTALVAIGACCWLAGHRMGPVRSRQPGQSLFSILTGYIFASASSPASSFTSDCISEEKREGTLGLLFLTD